MDKNRRYKRDIRLKLIKVLGGKCIDCGYHSNELALQIDHIYGRGASDKKRFKSQTTGYRYYLAQPEIAREQLQILCANCNTIKRFVNREINNKYG